MELLRLQKEGCCLLKPAEAGKEDARANTERSELLLASGRRKESTLKEGRKLPRPDWEAIFPLLRMLTSLGGERGGS